MLCYYIENQIRGKKQHRLFQKVMTNSLFCHFIQLCQIYSGGNVIAAHAHTLWQCFFPT